MTPTPTPKKPEKPRIFSVIRKESNHCVFNDVLVGNKENQLAVFSSESTTCKKLNRFQLKTNNLLSWYIFSDPFTMDYRLRQNWRNNKVQMNKEFSFSIMKIVVTDEFEDTYIFFNFHSSFADVE